jgi:asparagine synthase (glutamine-hydrolysing)
MCGVAGAFSLSGSKIPGLRARLGHMARLIAHRGPDDRGFWLADDESIGFAHVRLAIIDTGGGGHQPMVGPDGSVIAFNGEIYNYLELKKHAEGQGRIFRTTSDTETILAVYEDEGQRPIDRLRGMFAFAHWNPRSHQLTLVRDRFGIKPLYYAMCGDVLYFASEIKALLPFIPTIDTDWDALAEYLTFQYLLQDDTLFAGVKQLPPGHYLAVEPGGRLDTVRYWDVTYDIDYDHTEHYFLHEVQRQLNNSVDVHLRSDVEIGAYLSGGIDSTLIASLASERLGKGIKAYHGRFLEPDGYDESQYAQLAAESLGVNLRILDMNSADFERDLRTLIYHLDHPVAGPGSFPQFEVSRLAAQEVKVVLGGQGGDEIFGGYARYLVAYLEQCLRAAIDGTSNNGNFIVTLDSILPNLGVLREYQPLLQQFWREGLFGSLDQRFFQLIDRGGELRSEINWDDLDMSGVMERYMSIFNSTRNVRKEAYFDSMTHFEFKTLLPALLHVEDRVSMAHGLETRVPFLDHALIEFTATVPADVKFKGGSMKRLLKTGFREQIPAQILERRDKMGFPVPLTEWFEGPLKQFATGIFESLRDRHSPIFNGTEILASFEQSSRFSRKAWSLMSMEIWMQQFHDQAGSWRYLD